MNGNDNKSSLITLSIKFQHPPIDQFGHRIAVEVGVDEVLLDRQENATSVATSNSRKVMIM